MNGPDSIDHSNLHEQAASSMMAAPVMSRQEIARLVARGRDIRGEHLAQWGRNVARTWQSLFHRSHMLPPDLRSRIG